MIRGALLDLGYLGAGQQVDAAEAVDFFDALKTLVDGFPTQRLGMHEMKRVEHPLLALAASYTIGPGGEIDTPRPEFIDGARLVINANATANQQQETAVRVLSDGEWQSIGQKGLRTSYVTGIWYDYAFDSLGRGNLHVYPVPSAAGTTLALYLPQVAVGQFADYDTTDYTWAPGAARMLRKMLALELAPICQVPITAELRLASRRASDDFHERGLRPLELEMPSVGVREPQLSGIGFSGGVPVASGSYSAGYGTGYQ